MSELIDNLSAQKEALREVILEIHRGADREALRGRLTGLLARIPYHVVVEVEQRLIREGLPIEEIQALCDVHGQVLDGHVVAPPGSPDADHPATVFARENAALSDLVARIRGLDAADAEALRAAWQRLMDVDKHYRRKENLLFPYLEKAGIHGPPQVMWGRHDEIRADLKATWRALRAGEPADGAVAERALAGVVDMVAKEEQIFLPLCRDTLTEGDWLEVQRQSLDIGYCLVAPASDWAPSGLLPMASEDASSSAGTDGVVRFFTGSLDLPQLTSLLEALPLDLTFVDADDKVRYFSHGSGRVFDRDRAILGRDVRMCHPPHSVHVVERILSDFRAGRESRATFWITVRGRFVHIEYVALRDPQGAYLGCLEVTQALTAKRALEGEQRLLSYGR